MRDDNPMEHAENIKRRHLYGDTEALGEAWHEAKKEAEKHKGTPHQIRFDMATELARTKFDMSAFMRLGQSNSETLNFTMEMLSDAMRRLTILESAYTHISLLAHNLAMASAANLTGGGKQ